MSLSECMEKTTHRQYEVWIEWFDQQWDNPDRSDHYLMQIALEVRQLLVMINRMFGGKAKQPQWKDVRIDFGQAVRQAQSETRDTQANGHPSQQESERRRQAVQRSKSIWMAHLKDIPGVVYTPPPGREDPDNPLTRKT